MLANFEELSLRCHDEAAKNHIREAIRCYEASSYRAAIVMTYVAVCFDLIEKLKALSAAGDKEAKRIAEELENNQARQLAGDRAGIDGLLAFERGIISTFKDKFEFFGLNEYAEMVRLQEDRNRCAHPTFQLNADPYQPSAELARLHIRNALTLVLNQEPRQGKAALAHLKSIIVGSYFPTKKEEALERLRGSPLRTARESLVRAFVDDTMFGAATKGDPYYNKAASMLAFMAAVELHRGIAEPRAIANANKLLTSGDEMGVKVGAAAALQVSSVAEGLNDAAKGVMKGWIKSPTVNKGNALVRAMSISWLHDIAIDQIKCLGASDVKKMTIDPNRLIVERVVELISTVKSWDKAKEVVDNCGIKCADKFEREDVEKIANAAADGSADLISAGAFTRLLLAISSENPMGPDELLRIVVAAGLDPNKYGLVAEDLAATREAGEV